MKHPALPGSFWPTPTQEALLRVTLGPAADAEALWRELQPIDIQALEPGSFCLLPPLHERLSQVAPTDPRLPMLRGTCRSNWLRNKLLIEQVSELLPALGARGIEPLVIGGVSIITSWYSSLWSRPLPQFELAVDPGCATAAAEAAEAGCWRPQGRDAVHRWFVDDVGRRLVLHEGIPPLVAGPLGPADALLEFQARARYKPVLGAPMLVLHPADELVIACGLGARTTVPPTIQWLLDAAKALTRPDRPDPEELLTRARRYRLVDPVRDTVTYLAQIGVVELGGWSSALAAAPIPRRDTYAYRLSGLRASALGELPLVLSTGLRATSEQSFGRAVAELPRHIQQSWGATSPHQTATIAARKLLRLVRRLWPPAGATRHSVPAPGRKRSASS